MAKQTLSGAANQLVPTKPLSKTRALSRATPQGQAGYDTPREPITDKSTIKVLNTKEIHANLVTIDAMSSSDTGLILKNTGGGVPRISFETSNFYIQDEGSQLTIRGNTIVNQFSNRVILESGGGTQELNVAADEIQINSGTGIANFKVRGASNADIIETVFATDSVLLNAQGIGFYGNPPVARGAPVGNPVGGGVVDVESRAAITQLLTYLRTRGDILP